MVAKRSRKQKKGFFSRLFSSKQKISAEVLKAEREDSLKDLEAISDFLHDITDDLSSFRKQVDVLIELEKERKVANSGLLQINLQAQSDALDHFSSRYESFEDDVAIQGIRLKRVIREWMRMAKKAGMTDLVKKKKQIHSWLRYMK